MSQLILKYDELVSATKLPSGKVDNSVFHSALNFIRDWQNGKEVFEFKTSGSTGQPKSISIERYRMELSAQRTLKALGLASNQTALLCMSPQFIGGAMMMARAIIGQLNLIIVPPSRQPLEHVTERFDFSAMVPMQLSQILNTASESQLQLLHYSQHVLLGGAAISKDLQKQIESLDTRCWATYGMTETVSHIALKQLNGASSSQYFEVLDTVEIKQGDEGQLLIRDKLTKNRWLQTNDLIQLLTPKRFVWQGRLDNVINTGGIKVTAEKVESAIEEIIRQQCGNCRFFIAGLSDDTYGSTVTLFLETENRLDQNSLIENMKIQTNLSKYEIPRRIVLLNSFLETDSGKIDKQQILKSQ